MRLGSSGGSSRGSFLTPDPRVAATVPCVFVTHPISRWRYYSPSMKFTTLLFFWHSMRDLSSLSRDQTPVPCNGSRVLTTGPPGKFPYAFLMSEKPVKCTHHHPEWNKQRLFMALCSFRSHFTTRWVHVRLDLLPDKLWKLFVFHIFWFWIVDYEFWMCIIHTP